MIKFFRTLWRRHLFRDKGIAPAPRLIGMFLLLIIPLELVSLRGSGWTLFFSLNGLLILASMPDLLLSPSRNQLTCTRLVEEELERGQDFQITLRITNISGKRIRFKLVDDLPPSFQAPPFPLRGEIAGGQSGELTYRTKAPVRGDYELARVFLRYQSGLGLWDKLAVYSVPGRVRVIPDISNVRGFLGAAQKYLIEQGAKIKRNRLGSGEFAQIRAYVPGDDPRKINWRQTAKLSEIMTNVYEPEHGKYFTILIDCGRTMSVELKRGNRLELAFEAALTVAAVALRQGDYVSVLAFSNRVKAYIPPGKGLSHLRAILREIYNLQSDPAETNYGEAFQYLENVQKRQGFLLLFSDLEPFLFEDTPPLYLQRVGRKHRFLLLGIADPHVAKWLSVDPADTRLAMIKSTAQKEVLRKKQAVRRWGKSGIRMLEVPGEHLAAAAVSHYIEIVNRGAMG